MYTQTQRAKTKAKKAARISSASSTHQYSHPVLRFQRKYGNQVVQRLLQSGAIQAKLTIGQPDDKYEQEAERVAEQVMQKTNQPRAFEGPRFLAHESIHVLQQTKIQPRRVTAGKTLQRYAFLGEKQIRKGQAGLTPKMKKMVSDKLVRQYITLSEFKDHADNKTDYLGNLSGTTKVGTWLRFNPKGINLLGENHTLVTLADVVPAVGSKNFIYEIFSADTLAGGSAIKSAYEKEIKPEAKKFGITKVPDKKRFGIESLFPKMGFALTLAIPYFEKKMPVASLKTGNYVGQPIQRYLKIAWGYSKDNMYFVQSMLSAALVHPPMLLLITPKLMQLSIVHLSVQAQLDKFITSLPVNGYLGDELGKPTNTKLFAPLAKFARAFTEAMVEMAAFDKSSRLSQSKRKQLTTGKSLSEKEKMNLFSKWRNFHFEDNVKAAAKRGVRYAGMGQAHLDYLKKVGLPPNGHPYEMAGKDLQAFEALTQKLKKMAKRP
ncbi:MAG: hypothetical protein PVG22_14385 [Chromatiales bacterium]|jgi:hypothetical protein